MAIDFKHLNFPKVVRGNAQLHGGGSSSSITEANKQNRDSHYSSLTNKANEFKQKRKEEIANRIKDNLPDLPTSDFPLLLKVDPDKFDIDFLYTFNLEIVAQQEDGYIIVATDDLKFDEFLRKIEDFKNNVYGTTNIASIHEISEDERIERILSKELFEKWPFKDTSMHIVDIGLECMGIPIANTPNAKRKNESDEDFENRKLQKVMEIQAQWDCNKDSREEDFLKFLSAYGNEVEYLTTIMDNLEDGIPDSFTIRVKISGKALKDIVRNFPYIFEVVEPDEFMQPDNIKIELNDETIINIEKPNDSSPKVCVIDSGIQEKHKYISLAINEADSQNFVPNESTTGDNVKDGGHGTRVAGAILYPDGVSSLSGKGKYQLPCWIQNAKVLDSSNKMPVELFPPTLIRNIVNKYGNETRIFNHSICSRFPCRLRHMSAWSTEMDLLSYEKDVLFIQAAGNICFDEPSINNLGVKQHIENGRAYPEYLLENSSRISNPAQSLNSLTVGSICQDEFIDLITNQKSLEAKDNPSCFSRTGLGIWGAIKPEVVEYGGGYAINEGKTITLAPKEELCPELIRTTSSGPAYARDSVGTSFSTPKISHIAAKLQALLPEQPAILYRALIAHSAKWPEWTKDIEKENLLNVVRHIGYGLPNIDKALANDPNRITFISDGKMCINPKQAHLFKIPIPNELNDPGENKDILIEVTLSYIAKPRRTRMKKNGYLSSWLDWDVSKSGESSKQFEGRILKEIEKQESPSDSNKWMFGKKAHPTKGDGIIKNISRNSSTLQKDWKIIKSNELPDEFNIAVISHEGWDKNPKSEAFYSLVVSLEAINKDIEIYETVRNHIEIEIQSENEIQNQIEL